MGPFRGPFCGLFALNSGDPGGPRRSSPDLFAVPKARRGRSREPGPEFFSVESKPVLGYDQIMGLDLDTIIAEIEAACPEGETPARFLASVMAGIDPRADVSPLYRAVLAAGEGVPSQAAWEEIRALVLKDPAYKPGRVGFKDSAKAARILLEYLYPKLRSTEVSATVSAVVGFSPLTPDEVKTFEAWFTGEF